ncbi:hypothetical protein H6F52_08375 [Coleofasciculus sp. FACHB-542]|nr:hypothetical protein [Coleofasciculus sp. FACHB-542]
MPTSIQIALATVIRRQLRIGAIALRQWGSDRSILHIQRRFALTPNSFSNRE